MTAKIICDLARQSFHAYGLAQGYNLRTDEQGLYACHGTRKTLHTYKGAFIQGYHAGAGRIDIAIKALQAIEKGSPAPRTEAREALEKLKARDS